MVKDFNMRNFAEAQSAIVDRDRRIEFLLRQLRHTRRWAIGACISAGALGLLLVAVLVVAISRGLFQ